MDGKIGELTFKDCLKCCRNDYCMQEFLHGDKLDEHIEFNLMDELICKHFDDGVIDDNI